MEHAVWVQLNISALTLNPMGKRRCFEIEDYAGGYAAKAKCQTNQPTPPLSKHSLGVGSYSLRAYPLLREINVKDSERSMEFIQFLHILMSSWRRNKAKTLRWDPCERVLGRIDI